MFLLCCCCCVAFVFLSISVLELLCAYTVVKELCEEYNGAHIELSYTFYNAVL